jgi:hypothetical protein
MTKLLGRFKQSHNESVIEVSQYSAIFEGRAFDLTWIGDHAFYFQWTDENYYYYIKNAEGNGYEVIKYHPNDGYHKLIPYE